MCAPTARAAAATVIVKNGVRRETIEVLACCGVLLISLISHDDYCAILHIIVQLNSRRSRSVNRALGVVERE